MKKLTRLMGWMDLPKLALAGLLATVNASALTPAESAKAASRVVALAAEGTFGVDIRDDVWHDAARARDMPVRIMSPRRPSGTTETAAGYPVIIFSHGLGGSRDGGVLWGRHWASHGYIVVHLQHPGSDESVWKGKKPAAAASSMKRAMSLDNSRLRIADVVFALDEMKRLNTAGVAPFAMANLAKVGMSGHSFGAQTTLAVSGQQLPVPGANSSRDARIMAAIAFSPNARTKIGLDRQFAGITLPFFSITGTRDGSVLDDKTTYEDRLLPFAHMPPGNKYLVSFLDGDHMVFGGNPLGARRAETARDRDIQTAVRAATLAFWNATLKQDTDAATWLQQDFKSTLTTGDTFAYK